MKDVAADTLKSLHRGEVAATETYQQAMDGFKGEVLAELKRIHLEHRDAANTLRKMVHGHGGEPTHGSGAWGMFAKAVEGTATALGSSAAIQALKEGEENGLLNYEDVLEDPDLSAPSRSYLRDQLIPQTREHIATLNVIMQQL